MAESKMQKNNETQEIKALVRILNNDVKGNKAVLYALTSIKGIGRIFANAICKVTGISIHKKAGFLTDDEIEKIEDVVKNPVKYNFPAWMLNRRKDPETGDDKHLLTSDLEFTQENDLKILRKIKSYRGLRLGVGLTVRGQRTKSNFRNKRNRTKGPRKRK